MSAFRSSSPGVDLHDSRYRNPRKRLAAKIVWSCSRPLREDGLSLAFLPVFGCLDRGSMTRWFVYGKPMRDWIETCRCNAAPSLTSVPCVKISRIDLRDLLCFGSTRPKPLSNYSDSCGPRCQ